MHPVIMRQFAAEHIREKHARAEDERRARQARQGRRARRRALSTRPRLPVSGTLSPDDPRLDTGRQPAMHEPPSVPPEPVLAGSPPDSDDAVTLWTIAADQSEVTGLPAEPKYEHVF